MTTLIPSINNVKRSGSSSSNSLHPAPIEKNTLKASTKINTTEGRIQAMEFMMSQVGNYLTTKNWRLNSQQKALILKQYNDSKLLKRKNPANSDDNKAHNSEPYSIIFALNYWEKQYRFYPHLNLNTSSGKFMERIYKGYFTQFDPNHSWLSPNLFFDLVVINNSDNFLGMATIALILRIQILSQNYQCKQTIEFYNQFVQLAYSRIPDIYETPTYNNVLALLFMSIHAMSFNDVHGFLRYFSMTTRMVSALDLYLTYNTWTSLPPTHRDKEKYRRLNYIGKSICCLDWLMSDMFGQPRQFKEVVNWSAHNTQKEAIKIFNSTPFYTIPINPPRLINSFSTITPCYEEINALSYYIINRTRILKTDYSYLGNDRLIPPEDVFFEDVDFIEMLEATKAIQSKLVILYTEDLIKEYLGNTEHKDNVKILLERIVYALGLIITYNYPHILIFPQPALIKNFQLPKIFKTVEKMVIIFEDYFKLKTGNKASNEDESLPFRFEYLWRALLISLNISCQERGSKFEKQIKAIIKLITNHYKDNMGTYKLNELDNYLKRYGRRMEEFV